MKINYEIGDIIILTGGTYDEYGIVDTHKVVTQFNLRDLKDIYSSECYITVYKTPRYLVHDVKPDCEKFDDWLISKGFTQSIDVEELNFTEFNSDFTLDLDN